MMTRSSQLSVWLQLAVQLLQMHLSIRTMLTFFSTWFIAVIQRLWSKTKDSKIWRLQQLWHCKVMTSIPTILISSKMTMLTNRGQIMSPLFSLFTPYLQALRVIECLKSNQAFMTVLSGMWKPKDSYLLNVLRPTRHLWLCCLECESQRILNQVFLSPTILNLLSQSFLMPSSNKWNRCLIWLRHIFVNSLIDQKSIRVLVYAVVEVQAKDIRMAGKILLMTADHSDTYIIFRMKTVNQFAFRHAASLVAQHQCDLMTIVVNDISLAA
jgi:hypothetical protein